MIALCRNFCSPFGKIYFRNSQYVASILHNTQLFILVCNIYRLCRTINELYFMEFFHSSFLNFKECFLGRMYTMCRMCRMDAAWVSNFGEDFRLKWIRPRVLGNLEIPLRQLPHPHLNVRYVFGFGNYILISMFWVIFSIGELCTEWCDDSRDDFFYNRRHINPGQCVGHYILASRLIFEFCSEFLKLIFPSLQLTICICFGNWIPWWLMFRNSV